MTSEWTKQVLEDNFNFSQNEKEDPPRQPGLFATKEGSRLQFKNPHIEIKFVGGLPELRTDNCIIAEIGILF